MCSLGMDFVSSTIQRPLDLGALPQDSLHASSSPTSHSMFSWGSSYHSPKATHRMWSAMDLPLLRNMYSVLFAKYESEFLTPGLTRGRACWGGSPKLQSSFNTPRKSTLPAPLASSLREVCPPGVKELVYKSCSPSLWAETQTRAGRQLGCF